MKMTEYCERLLVRFSSPGTLATATVTVAVAKVPGEENLTNNRSEYSVIFTR